MIIGIDGKEAFILTCDSNKHRVREYAIQSTIPVIEQMLVDYYNEEIRKLADIKKTSCADVGSHLSVMNFTPPSYSEFLEWDISLNKDHFFDVATAFSNLPSFWETVLELTDSAQRTDLFCIFENAAKLYNLYILYNISYFSYLYTETNDHGNNNLQATSIDRSQFNTVLSFIAPVAYSLSYVQDRLMKIYEVKEFQLITVLLSEMVQQHRATQVIDFCSVCGKMFICKGHRYCSVECSKKRYEHLRRNDTFYKILRNYNNRLSNAAEYLSSASTESADDVKLREDFYNAKLKWENLVYDVKTYRKENGFTRTCTNVGISQTKSLRPDYSMPYDIYQLVKAWEDLNLEGLCSKVQKLNKKRRITK